MAGDTLRGIGKKAIAEALEAAAAAEHTTETNGTAPTSAFALGDNQGQPERSLDELPSERTGHHPPGDSAVAATNHAGNDALAGTPITTAPTLVQDAPAVPDAPAPMPGAATLPGTSTTASTGINTAVTIVDDAAPLGSSTSAPRSGPNRVSFGTMIGHEVHAVHARVADAEAAGRGTAHGHDVHLPGHPAMGVEAEIAPGTARAPSVRGLPVSHAEPASALAEYLAPARDSQNEFSGGDHSFFDTAPINDEYEPENPRGRLYTRLAVSGAVVAVVAVVVVAWANSRGASQEPPVEVKTQPAVTAPVRTAVATPPPARPAPPPAPPQEPPTSTIPSSMPERIAVTTPPPHPAKAPSLAPPAPAPAPRPAVPIAAAAKSAGVAVSAAPVPKPAPAAAPPAPKPAPIAAAAPRPASAIAPVAAAPKASAPVAAAPAPVRELRTPPPPPQKKPTAVAAAAPHPAATPAPHAAAPAPTPFPATRPAPTVAKVPQSAPSRPVAKSTPARASKAPARGKQKYDPDGTLPLSFE